MVDLLRRHAAIVVALVLAWLGYSDMNPDVGKKKAEAKIERREIGEASLRLRGPDEHLPAIVDPYRLAEDAARDAAIRAAKLAAKPGSAPARPAGSPGSHPTTGGSPKPAGSAGPQLPSDPAEVAAAWLGALRLLGRDVTAFARDLVHGPAPAGPPAPGALGAPGAMAEPPPRPVTFVLHLESTLSLPDGGQARISGQTVEVGASLEGLDPEKPPRLLSVRGTEAVVAHGDDLYVLDLVTRPVVTVGEPALAAADAARDRAGDAMAPAPPRAAAAAHAPAKPAAAAAGASGGGKVPHVRKFPTKKKP